MAANGVIVQGELVEKSYAERIEEEVNSIIKKNTLLATGAGLIPIPGLDVAAMTAVTTRMTRQIGEAYGLETPDQDYSLIIQSLVTSIISKLSAIGVRKAFNSFANFGTLADELTNAAVSGAVTAAVGEIYKIHFASGGNFDDLKISHYIDYIQEKLSDGSLSPGSISSLSNPFKHLT